MTVLILEDEGVAARRLQKLVAAEGLKVIGHLSSNEELRTYLKTNQEPDLYLMDIHLSDGIIFEVLQEVSIQSPIIFTTAYDQYAIKAFKQNSIDYLLKPIQEEELKAAIDKFKQRSAPQIDIIALSQLLMQGKSAPTTYRSRISIKIGDHIKSLLIEDITHFFSRDKINYAHHLDGRNYPIDYTLETMLADLNPKQFSKISRSHIININHIADVISYSNSRLKVKMAQCDDEDIIVARERVKDFKQWLG